MFVKHDIKLQFSWYCWYIWVWVKVIDRLIGVAIITARSSDVRELPAVGSHHVNFHFSLQRNNSTRDEKTKCGVTFTVSPFLASGAPELPQLVVLLPLGLIKNCLCVPQTGPVCHPARFQRLDANSDSSGRGKDEDNIKYCNMITTDSKDSNDNSDMS